MCLVSCSIANLRSLLETVAFSQGNILTARQMTLHSVLSSWLASPLELSARIIGISTACPAPYETALAFLFVCGRYHLQVSIIAIITLYYDRHQLLWFIYCVNSVTHCGKYSFFSIYFCALQLFAFLSERGRTECTPVPFLARLTCWLILETCISSACAPNPRWATLRWHAAHFLPVIGRGSNNANSAVVAQVEE